MTPVPARAATLRRLLVALGVALLLFGDVFRGLHLLTERHVVCAEHGELVHAADGDPRGSGAAATLGARVAPGDSSAHHHDHCGLGTFRTSESGALLASSPAVLAAEFSVVSPLAPASTDVPRPEALSYAPKQSPPA